MGKISLTPYISDGQSILEVAFLISDVAELATAIGSGEGLLMAAANVAIDVVAVASPVPGISEAAHAIEGAVKVEKAAAHAVEATAKGVEAVKTGEGAAAEAKGISSVKEEGSYTNTHESGKTYDGKGSRERSQESGRRVQRDTGDQHTATEWTPSGSTRDAFKDESKRLESHGGSKSDSNYNKIDSPGTKMRAQDGD